MKNRVYVMIHLVARIVVELVELVEPIVVEQLNCCCGSFYCYYIDYAWNLDREQDDGVH